MRTSLLLVLCTGPSVKPEVRSGCGKRAGSPYNDPSHTVPSPTRYCNELHRYAMWRKMALLQRQRDRGLPQCHARPRLCITLWNLNRVTHSRVLDSVKEKPKKVVDRVKGKPEKPYERLRNLYANNKVEKRVKSHRSADCAINYDKCWHHSDCCDYRAACLWAGPAGRGYCDWFWGRVRK